jgi:hypothetical protein
MASAAIRFNNPGAMWGKGNRIATKWGATSTTVLNDGLGQGNNIAYFPTKIQGACAQFDLWRTGYCNMTLRNAILKWSGHNWSEPYAQSLCAASGLTLDTIITPEVLASLRGLRLIVAQAKWEAGTVYPLTTAEWLQAQDQVFRNAPPVSVRTKKAAGAGAVVVAGGGAAATIASQGHHWGVVLLVLIVAVVGGGVAWFVIHRRHEKATTPPLPKAFSAIGGPVVPPESSPIPRFGAPL